MDNQLNEYEEFVELAKNEVEEILKNMFKNKIIYCQDKGTHFETDIYVDYRDEMSDRQIERISQATHMMDAFYDELSEYEMNCQDHELDEALREIKKNWDEEKHGEYELYEDIIEEWVKENVYFNFPFDHYLKTDVLVNIVMDTGDGNYDYTLNNLCSYNSQEDDEINEESSILWLVRQQGYTKGHLENAIKGHFEDNKFLKSVIQECENVTSMMNALVFSVKMTLKEFIDLSDNKKSLVISKSTSCGLVDFWNGAGGVLEIELEKDIHLPSELFDAHIDGARGYGIDSIYGMHSSHWTDSVIELK